MIWASAKRRDCIVLDWASHVNICFTSNWKAFMVRLGSSLLLLLEKVWLKVRARWESSMVRKLRIFPALRRIERQGDRAWLQISLVLMGGSLFLGKRVVELMAAYRVRREPNRWRLCFSKSVR
eukprot:g34226.t1